MSKWNPADHLPECGVTRYPICICDRLRACEERVRKSSSPLLCTACWHGEDDHSCDRPERCVCRVCNYAAGLDAARDAVAALPVESRGIAMKDDALAVIDALREQS